MKAWLVKWIRGLNAISSNMLPFSTEPCPAYYFSPQLFFPQTSLLQKNLDSVGCVAACLLADRMKKSCFCSEPNMKDEDWHWRRRLCSVVRWMYFFPDLHSILHVVLWGEKGVKVWMEVRKYVGHWQQAESLFCGHIFLEIYKSVWGVVLEGRQ